MDRIFFPFPEETGKQPSASCGGIINFGPASSRGKKNHVNPVDPV
jgi:hypothetical protein